MNTKIIFFDIDGTILSHRTLTISDSTKAAIKQAQANGHLAFINTGRTLGELDEQATDIGFDGYVCGCGTYISYKDSILHEEAIPSAITRELIQDFHKYHIEAILEGKTAVYYDSVITNPVVKKIKEEHSTRFNIKGWDDPEMSIDKFCIWPESKEDYLQFYQKYNHCFEFIKRTEHFLEVIPIGCSKATGIQFLKKYLNIPYENTYAIGDSTNDLSMLQCVKHSIGMGNSCKEILEMVSYVTDDVDQDGVAKALKYYNII